MNVTESPPAQSTAKWRRLAIGSSLAMGIWALALQSVLGAFIVPVTVVGLVFVAIAVVVSRSERTWTRIVTALVPLLALGGNLGPIGSDLAHPDAAVVFTLTVVSVTAALVTSLSGFMLWLGRSDGAVGPVAAVAGGLVVVAAVVGAVAASGVESAEALPGDVAVATKGLSFGTEEVVLPAGTSGVWVDNPDPAAHTFSIGGTDIDLDLPANSSQRVDVDLAPGSYSVFCAIPGHESMTATLVVEG